MERRKITELSKKCRIDFSITTNPDFAMSTKSDVILFEGKEVKRKRIILLTVGCGIGSCVMCPFPAESNINVSQNNLINQFDNSFLEDDINSYEHVTIFCNGNFFSNREISDDTRNYMFEKIGKSSVKSVTVESLPQFITEEKIKKIKSLLGDKKLQVYIGLQSSNDFIRKYSINTTCTRPSFEKAVKILFKYGFSPAAFVLIKPPFLTEDEARKDVLDTLMYLDKLKVYHTTLCPVRVSDGTLLKRIYEAGYYTSLSIWTVVDILIEYAKFGKGLPMVNTTELKQDVNKNSICAYSCEKCNKKVIEAIEEYLFTRDVSILSSLNCECRSDRMSESYSNKPITQRINEFYGLEN